MEKEELRKKIIKNVLDITEKQEAEELLNSELNEISGGNRSSDQHEDLEDADSCKCIAIAFT